MKNIAVILHGGAGVIGKELAQQKQPVLEQAREAAWSVLEAGGSAENAVVDALHLLEASQYFNAGYGAYLDQSGKVSLDAGLMRGNGDFISVLFARNFLYPSKLLAERFSPGMKLSFVWTEEEAAALERHPLKDAFGWTSGEEEMIAPHIKRKDFEVVSQGTVGCLARDCRGQLFAGTSTGGVANKYRGRVGDSPLIGHGVFADNELGALSTTGYGEAFMRSCFSGFVLAEVRRKGEIHSILESELKEMKRKCGGTGGVIFLPPAEDPTFAFNSPQMALATKYYQKATSQVIETAVVEGGEE